MKPNKIKICGITDLSIANFCIDNNADYLGFVSYMNTLLEIYPCMTVKTLSLN